MDPRRASTSVSDPRLFRRSVQKSGDGRGGDDVKLLARVFFVMEDGRAFRNGPDLEEGAPLPP